MTTRYTYTIVCAVVCSVALLTTITTAYAEVSTPTQKPVAVNSGTGTPTTHKELDATISQLITDIQNVQQWVAALERREQLEREAQNERILLLRTRIAEVRALLILMRQEKESLGRSADSSSSQLGTYRRSQRSEFAPQLSEVAEAPTLSGTLRQERQKMQSSQRTVQTGLMAPQLREVAEAPTYRKKPVAPTVPSDDTRTRVKTKEMKSRQKRASDEKRYRDMPAERQRMQPSQRKTRTDVIAPQLSEIAETPTYREKPTAPTVPSDDTRTRVKTKEMKSIQEKVQAGIKAPQLREIAETPMHRDRPVAPRFPDSDSIRADRLETMQQLRQRIEETHAAIALLREQQKVAVPHRTTYIDPSRMEAERRKEKVLLEIRDSLKDVQKDVAVLKTEYLEDKREKATAPIEEGVSATPIVNRSDMVSITPRDKKSKDEKSRDTSSAAIVTTIIIIILILLIGGIPAALHWRKKKQMLRQNNQWNI